MPEVKRKYGMEVWKSMVFEWAGSGYTINPAHLSNLIYTLNFFHISVII